MGRLVLVSVVVLVAFGGVTCTGESQHSAPVAPSQKAGLSAPAPDPGPLLQHDTGPGVVETMSPIVVAADARLRAEGHHYVRVPYPKALDSVVLGDSGVARLVLEGTARGMVVPAGQGRLRDRPWFYVRLGKGVELGEKLVVEWHQPARRRDAPGRRQRVEVAGIADAPVNEGLAEHFATAASTWFSRNARSGFGAFAAARMQSMNGAKASRDRTNPQRRASRTSLTETMSLMTGLTSVEEALQADRGLGLAGGLQMQRRIHGLETVRGVNLSGHPWEKMIEKLATGAHPKQPVVESLAHAAPAEMAYFHMGDIGAVASAWQSLAPTAAPLFESTGFDLAHLVSRYARQLMLRPEVLVASLGPAVASSAALVTSSPYLGDGTDLTMLFTVGDGHRLDAVLDAETRWARRAHPEAQETTIEILGRSVRRTQTQDGTLRQFRVRVNDVQVVSNSPGAVKRILATLDGGHPALADSGEFRYFRALQPYAAKEPGYLFLGDAFVGQVVGPRQKILQSRRMRVRAEIRSAGYAALLHGWLEGRPASSVKSLLAGPALRAEDLVHHDGTPIHLDPKTGADSQWGNAVWVTPIIDLELTQVTEEERGAYQRFAETYQSYWQRFIDPIGIQLTTSDVGIDIHGRMLPLLRRSEYRELIDLVGKTRLELGGGSKGLRFAFAVAQDSKIRRNFDTLSRTMSGHRDVGLGWLGDWIMVGSADRSGLWDLALAIGEVPSRLGTHNTRRADLRKQVINRSPIYAAVHVRNPLVLAATLAGLKVQLTDAGAGLAEWGPTEPYGDVQVVKIEETLSRREVEQPLSLFYAVVDGVFLVSFDRPTLEAQIDSVRAGAVPRTATNSDAGPQAALAYRPETTKGYLNRTLLGMAEHVALGSHLENGMHFETIAVGLGRRGSPVSEVEALGFLGRVPASLHGGAYRLGENGLVHHQLYGEYIAPNTLAIPVKDSNVTKAFEAIEALRMSVGFEGEGGDRALVTHLHWARR